jgi:hypothetical protein
VVRLEDVGHSDLYHADIRIECRGCHTPFHFKGLPLGLNLQGATVSFDGLEARLAIGPGRLPPTEKGEGQ